MQIKRELGISYPTAWRMLHQIRLVMHDRENRLLSGIVEIDESYIGWRRNYRFKKFDGGNEQVVIGMVERKGIKRMIHIPDNSRYQLWKSITENIDKGTHLMTDAFPSYKGITRYDYKHDYVAHQSEYVRGNVHTQTIESGWGQLKRSLSGTYHHVSKKHLQKYLYEFEWRYNHRNEEDEMFNLLILQSKTK